MVEKILALVLTLMVVDLSEGHNISLLPTKGRDCFTDTIDHVRKVMDLMKTFRGAKMIENKNLSCIASCLLKRYGVMSNAGILDVTKTQSMAQKIKEPTFKMIIEMRLSTCVEDASSQDHCDTAAKFLDCVAKSGSYKNWGNVFAKNFKNIFGAQATMPEPPATTTASSSSLSSASDDPAGDDEN